MPSDNGYPGAATQMGWRDGGKIMSSLGTGLSFITSSQSSPKDPPKPCYVTYHNFQRAKWSMEHETGLFSLKGFRCWHFNLQTFFTVENRSKVLRIQDGPKR